MVDIPERYLRFALIGASVYFIVVGLLSIAFSAHKFAPQQAVTTEKDEVNQQEIRSEAMSAIISGFLEAATGIFGLIAVILKKRVLLIIFAGALVLAFVSNIVVMVFIVINTRHVKDESVVNAKDNMVRLYGNKTDDASLAYTLDINTHQRQVGCCGWSNDPADNIYLRTPFYFYEKMEKFVQADNYKTLPESCCIKVSSACYRTKDLKKARADKLVFKHDCLTKMINNANVYLVVTLFKAIFVCTVQILGVTAIVLYVPKVAQTP